MMQVSTILTIKCWPRLFMLVCLASIQVIGHCGLYFLSCRQLVMKVRNLSDMKIVRRASNRTAGTLKKKGEPYALVLRYSITQELEHFEWDNLHS
jgi:hypothetical protein